MEISQTGKNQNNNDTSSIEVKNKLEFKGTVLALPAHTGDIWPDYSSAVPLLSLMWCSMDIKGVQFNQGLCSQG